MYDVFISYPRSERARAEPVRRRLEALGLNVFFDLDGIDGGKVFPDVITRALDNSKAVIACCSPLYFTRPWCLTEAREGHARDVLVPVTLTKFERVHPPADLRHLNYLDLVGWDGSDGHEDWTRAIRSVGRLVGRDLKAGLTISGASAAPKPAAGQWAPFDVDQLHPAVRAAALQARQAERDAHVKAAEARRAAERADDAARRARAGEAGTYVYTGKTQRWESEGSDNKSEGHGVWLVVSGDGAGDAYRGQWRDDAKSGLGIYTFAENENNAAASNRYEGEYAGGKRNGLGVYGWKSEAMFAGGFRDEAMTGYGVYRFKDGRRYEGEHSADRYDGFGVFWGADGSVAKAGSWKNNEFVASLTK